MDKGAKEDENDDGDDDDDEDVDEAQKERRKNFASKSLHDGRQMK